MKIQDKVKGTVCQHQDGTLVQGGALVLKKLHNGIVFIFSTCKSKSSVLLWRCLLVFSPGLLNSFKCMHTDSFLQPRQVPVGCFPPRCSNKPPCWHQWGISSKLGNPDYDLKSILSLNIHPLTSPKNPRGYNAM